MKLIEIVLIAAGLAMLATYFAARAHGEAERQAAIASFEATRVAALEPAPVAVPAVVHTLETAQPDSTDWSESRRAAYERTPAATPLALLRIDSVDLEVPVFHSTGERDLNRGAGHIEGTPAPGEPGNVGLAAHRDGWFRALEHVALGDEIELVTRRELVRYRVTDLRVVEPTDVSVLGQTDDAALTLVTCYPFYFVGSAPQRYIVRAVAIN